MDALAEKTVEVSYKIRRVSLPAVPITAHFVPAGDPRCRGEVRVPKLGLAKLRVTEGCIA
jgi:hypothetical protein